MSARRIAELEAENSRLKREVADKNAYIATCESMIPSEPDKGNLLPVKILRLQRDVTRLKGELAEAAATLKPFAAMHRERDEARKELTTISDRLERVRLICSCVNWMGGCSYEWSCAYGAVKQIRRSIAELLTRTQSTPVAEENTNGTK